MVTDLHDVKAENRYNHMCSTSDEPAFFPKKVAGKVVVGNKKKLF